LNLKAIARDAALRGDTKTLFHTLDLLEQLMPIALCFKSAFFNGSLSHLPTAISAACSGASNIARAVQ